MYLVPGMCASAIRRLVKNKKIGLKIRLFGFLRGFDGVHDNAAHKVISSSTLIGPFNISVYTQIEQPLAFMLKFEPVLWVALCVTKTSLVVKEMRVHA